MPTYAEFKEFLDKATPEQLAMKMVVFKNDAEIGELIHKWEVSPVSFYWLEGECYGDLKTTMEQIKLSTDVLTLDDFVRVPAGTITLHIENDTKEI